MMHCPGKSFTHFSFFMLRLSSSVLCSCFLVARYMAASTLFSQSSGRPSVLTNGWKTTYSVSGAIMAVASHPLRPSVPGACSSSRLMPSNMPFRCDCTFCGSFAWPRISSRSSALMK